MVYQREPHARQMAFKEIAQPKTRAERVTLAKKTLAELKLDVEVWIDDLGDASRAAFGDVPNPAIVLDTKGIIRMKLSWSDPAVLQRFLPELLPQKASDGPSTAEDEFLKSLPGTKPAADATPAERERLRHHRHVMLAQLVLAHPEHEARERWLEELGDESAPAWQRAFALRLRAKKPQRPKQER